MAYIGHSASGNFTTKPSKDTFSGNASTTAFTLSEFICFFGRNY